MDLQCPVNFKAYEQYVKLLSVKDIKMFKKLPPYGSYLNSLSIPPKNSVYIFCGNKAWEKSSIFQKFRKTTLCLPPWLCASKFKWPVQGCDILIFDTGWADESYLSDFAGELYFSNAKIVRCVSPLLEIFKFTK
jgi:hypothetical protein